MITLKLLVIYTNVIGSPITTSHFEFQNYFCASIAEINEVLKCFFPRYISQRMLTFDSPVPQATAPADLSGPVMARLLQF